ncbi:MAG: PLP-dependent aminotransferase family protein [Acidimicrobiales bacterium]|nr:PLP-dependent aminotransferase family protein [Acidimicrobiales bacterium]
MRNRATSARVARAAAVHHVVGELGDWATGGTPLFRLLARALAAAVERGSLTPGERLPAERALATAVSVSRGTAVAAYDLLVADGVVERLGGSGTFVIGAGSLGLPLGREGSALVARLVDRSTSPSSVIDLSISVLRLSKELPATSVGTSDLADVAPDTGYSPWGLVGLRRAVAHLVSERGLPTGEDQVVITTGAQQALSTAAACWVRPGDTVLVEDPTYPGAVSAFAAAGARLVGLPVDRHGVRPDALRDALAHHPTLVYLQPTLHSPTGVVLAANRRREVAEVLAGARVPLVEDHALAGLVWGDAPAPVGAHRPDHAIAVVGSLSKLFWGGLRVGFVRAPAPVALRFARVKGTHDLGSSAISQVLAQRLLEHPDTPAFLTGRNEALRARYDQLATSLRRELPDWTWTEPSGGLSVWVRLPSPVAEPFAQAALRNGVAVATAEALSPGGGHPDRVRLSFSGPAEELAEGVQRLATTWRST